MSDRLALPRRYREQLEALLSEHVPGVEVWAYGSRVNGESHDGSDLDLALRGPALEPLDGGYYDLLEAIEKSNIPILVQAHDWAMLPESFHREIELDYVVVQEGVGKQTTAGEWCEVALGDIAEIVMGQSPPGDKVSGDNGLALLNGPTEFGASHPTPVQFTIDARKYAQPGDILFCVRGSTTGRINWADQEYAIGHGVAAIRHKNDSALQPLVRGVIELGLPELLAQATGSTFPNVSAQQLAEIPYPSLDEDEQRAIAHILGTLDDKIELNRRMNETLEAMARALFKSWFVDFEPVRAKMEGRWRHGESLPGLPADLYDLFPDRLVDSELGEVPDGWEVKALGECLATLETGKRPAGGVSGIESGMPSVGAESIERVGVFEFGKTKFVPWEFYDSMKRGIVQDGDVLIYKDGGRPGELSPAVTYTSHGFPFSECCINEHVFRVRSSLFSQQLLYCYLTTPYAFWQMREFATGAAQPGLNQRAVEAIAITMPGDRRVLRVCEEVIGPLIDGCNANALVSRDLSQIRDVLLPKLASGEIRII